MSAAVGSVIAFMGMSLDGFVAGPNDEVDRIHSWVAAGDTEFRLSPTDEYGFKVSRASADLLRETWTTTGATLVGRRTFDLAGAWGGNPPGGLPIVVLTHSVPPEWAKDSSPFTFVTDGVESAVERARQAAGDRDVGVSGASVIQQCLRAGLLDELYLDLVPVLLGSGIRLFDDLGTGRIELERTRVVAGSGVTHLHFRVRRVDSAPLRSTP
jgi:dihydrofolate reductase